MKFIGLIIDSTQQETTGYEITKRSIDTEFGRYVFENGLTTFEALSDLEVVSLGNKLVAVQNELNQTRSELNDVSVALDQLTVRVNTQGFQIADNIADIENLQIQLSSVSTVANNAATAASQAQTTANNAVVVAGAASSAAGAAQTTANSANAAASAAQSTASAAQTTADLAQTAANNAVIAAASAASGASAAAMAAALAQSAADSALAQVQALTTPSQWRIPALLGATNTRYITVAFPNNQQWTYGVRLDVPAGEVAQTSQEYSGDVVAYNASGTWQTSGLGLGSFQRIIFIAQENFNPSSSPVPAPGSSNIRPGSYWIRYGTSSTYTVTEAVRVVDIIDSPF